MKRILSILLILTMAMFAFASCGDKPSNNPGGDNPGGNPSGGDTGEDTPTPKTAFECVSNVASAKTIVITTTVKDADGEDVSSSVETYNFETKKVTTVTKTLAPLDSDEMWKTETTEASFTTFTVSLALQLTDFNTDGFTNTETSLTASITKEVAKSKLNLDSSSDVTFSVSVANEALVSLAIGYTSTNGNSVTITTEVQR